MANIYLDTETAGLNGRIFLIQFSIERSPVRFIKGDDVEGMKKLFVSLGRDTNTVITFNGKFDFHKLYELKKLYFNDSRPFKCHLIDLYNHVITKKPLNDYPIMGKKILVLRKILVKYEDKITEMILNWLNANAPKTYQIPDGIKPPFRFPKPERKREKDGFVDLVFRMELSKKLKSLVYLFMQPEAKLAVEDVFKLPPKIKGLRGRKTETNDPGELQKCYDENMAILQDPNSPAWTYSRLDVEYLWALEDWLNRENPLNPVAEIDADKVAHSVAYTKYMGFGLDHDGLSQLQLELEGKRAEIKDWFGEDFNPGSSKQRIKWLKERADFVQKSSKDALNDMLEVLAKSPNPNPDEELRKGIKYMLEYGSAGQKLEQVKYLQKSERLHADLNVMGTSSYRMSGCGGFNVQGISGKGDIRKYIKTSMGGDFSSLELCIAANMYKDETLISVMRDGYDMHMLTMILLATETLKKLIPTIPWSNKDLAYKALKDMQVYGTEEQKRTIKEYRGKAKMINFAILYFASDHLISKKLNISEEEAQKMMEENFFIIFKTLKSVRDDTQKLFCTIDTNTWRMKGMATSVENMYGTKRSVKFIVKFINFIWENVDKISEVATGDNDTVIRREKKGAQAPKQALRSALLGSILSMQQTLFRQLGNFPIQSTGAELTKKLIARIWDVGRIPMLNVHDEIVIPDTYESCYTGIAAIVSKFIEEQRKIIRYLRMDFIKMSTWDEKK